MVTPPPAGARESAALEMDVQRKITATKHHDQHHEADEQPGIDIHMANLLSRCMCAKIQALRRSQNIETEPALLAYYSATPAWGSRSMSSENTSFFEGHHRATRSAPHFLKLCLGGGMKADVRSRKGIWLLQTSFSVDAQDDSDGTSRMATGRCSRKVSVRTPLRVKESLSYAPLSQSINCAGSIPAPGPNLKPK